MAWIQEGKKGCDLSDALCAWRLPLGKQRQWEGESFSESVVVNSSSHFTPTQISGPGSPLNRRSLRETLLPWRPTELAKRQGMQSALVGPPFLNSSWGEQQATE